MLENMFLKIFFSIITRRIFSDFMIFEICIYG